MQHGLISILQSALYPMPIKILLYYRRSVAFRDGCIQLCKRKVELSSLLQKALMNFHAIWTKAGLIRTATYIERTSSGSS